MVSFVASVVLAVRRKMRLFFTCLGSAFGFVLFFPRSIFVGEEIVQGLQSFQVPFSDFSDSLKDRLKSIMPEEGEETKEEEAQEPPTLASYWEEGNEEEDKDWLNGSGLKFHTSGDKAWSPLYWRLSGFWVRPSRWLPNARRGDCKLLKRCKALQSVAKRCKALL